MKPSYFTFLLFGALNISTLHCDAQYKNKLSPIIFEMCYKFKFRSADSLIKIAKSEPGTKDLAEISFMEANILWWKTISGQNENSIKKEFYNKLKKSEQLLEGNNNNIDNQILFKIVSTQGYLVRMDMLSKSYFKTLVRTNKFIKYLKKSFGNESKYPFFYLTSGIYNYYRENATESYPILSPYIKTYPPGNKKLGLQYLEKASESENSYISTESIYFLMKIYFDEKKYTISLNLSEKLCKKYPENGIFMYYKYLSLLFSGKRSEAWTFMKQMNSALLMNKEIKEIQIHHFKNLMMNQWNDTK